MDRKGRRVTAVVPPERRNRGEKNNFAKLTEDIVREIRFRYRAGESQKGLAGEYGVSRASVCLIVGGKTWAHVTE